MNNSFDNVSCEEIYTQHEWDGMLAYQQFVAEQEAADRLYNSNRAVGLVAEQALELV